MTLLIHTAITCALVGLIWTVQIVIYPLFSQIGPEAFRTYHLRYTTRIGLVVAPLMFAELGTAALLLYQGERSPWFLVSLVLLALNWLSTWIVQIPLHKQLERGYSSEAQDKLVKTNWLRTFAWSLRGLCLIVLIR
jgi:hypothetical protein